MKPILTLLLLFNLSYASLSYIKGENVLAGAVSASLRETLSPLVKYSKNI